MRILIASTHRVVVGGVETYLRDLIPALRRRGHVIGVLTSAAEDPSAPDRDPFYSDLPTWSLAGPDPESAFREVERWNPDVAYLHGMDTPAEEEGVVNRFPTVLFAHGHNATCVSGSRTLMFPTPRPCTRRFGPACLCHYLPRRCGGLNPLTAIYRYRAASRRQEALTRFSSVIVGSRFMADEYQAHGVPADRLHRIPLFPTDAEPATTPLADFTSSRLLLLGRLYPEKGTRLIIGAVREASDRLRRTLTLVVAGEGPERATMQDRAKRVGVPAEFQGWVETEQRNQLMRGASLLCIPSVCPETFGLVGVEAACLGLPSVAFQVGGIPDWLVPGVTGELAPGEPPTSSAFAEAICRALGDPVHWQKLSAGALAAARTFSIGAHVAVLECVLAAAAANARPQPTAAAT